LTRELAFLALGFLGFAGAAWSLWRARRRRPLPSTPLVVEDWPWPPARVVGSAEDLDGTF
jgi:hypothetical protein